MNLDLRIPMGLMFSIVGAILTIFGAATNGSPIYEKSVGMNINLIWGVVMLIFGITMFFMGKRSQTKPKPAVQGTTRPLGHGGHRLQGVGSREQKCPRHNSADNCGV